MADAKGKKGKKSGKKTVMSLDEFVSSAPSSATGLELDWASELENNLPSESFSSRTRGSIDKSALPSAPRSILGVELDLEKIPEQAPFSVYMHNAPFEVTHEQINRYFLPLVPVNITLGNDMDRKKPPLVEFETRDMLIKALKERNDSMLGSRKVTLKLQSELDSYRRDGGRDYNRSGGMGQDRRNSGPDVTLGNWRTAQAPAGPPSPTFSRPPVHDFVRPAPRDEQRYPPREEEFRMERAPMSPALPPHPDRRPGPDSRYDRPIERGPIERGPIERGPIERGPIERGPIERGPIERGPPAHVQPFNQERGPRFEALERADSRDDTMSRGSYGSHPPSRPMSRDTSYGDLPPPDFDGRRGDRGFTGGRDRGGGGGGRRTMDQGRDPVIRRNDSFQRVETHGEDQGLQMRRSQPAFTPQISREGGLSRQESRDSQAPAADQPVPPTQRPKLQLQPRTKPVEDVAAATGATSAIFGGAKPVDTTAREREIEEKRRKEEEALKEKIRLEIEEKAKAAAPSKPLLSRSGSNNAPGPNDPAHPRRDYPREQPPHRGGPVVRAAPVAPGDAVNKDEDWKRLQDKNRILRQTSSNASESSDRGSITDTRRVDEGELDADLEEVANGEEGEPGDDADFIPVVHGRKHSGRLPTTAASSSTAQYNSRVFSNSSGRGGGAPRRARGAATGRGAGRGGNGGASRGRGAPLRANGVQATGGARKGSAGEEIGGKGEEAGSQRPEEN